MSIWPFLRKKINFYKPNFSDIFVHLKPNLVLFIPVIAVSLYKVMDKIMLGQMINKTQVGYYENSEKIIQIPMALITALGTVMLPKISNLVGKKNKDIINIYIENSIMFSVVLISILFVLQ